MIWKQTSYEGIAERVKKEQKRVVIYGAGMIGKTLMPYLITKFDLAEYIECYVDADENKQGKEIVIANRKIRIFGLDILGKLGPQDIVLVTNSNYYPVVELLDSLDNLKDVEGFLIPFIQVSSTHDVAPGVELARNEEMMIPKIIHYCWFSGKPLPSYLEKCLESWKRYCPDYEIVKWDENSYDVNKYNYTRDAFATGKYGFVPDIARLEILYEYGGIYLDTDVELLRNLDDLLYQDAFVGVEKWGSVNFGGGSGSVPHNPVIKKVLDYRKNEQFVLEDGSFNLMTCGYYESMPLMELGMTPDNTIQFLEGITVYSSDFFHPYDYMSGETTITENTFSIHHFNGGWIDESRKKERNESREQYRRMLERMNGIK